MLVETEVSRLEERLSHLEAELADVRNARADDAPPISPMLAAPPDAPSDYL
jgi:capsule polysaccharide export protein KpsE/RkpR